MTLNMICLQHCSIFEQLEVEEALMRSDQRNWCLINEGSSKSIVMGISGKPDELINQEKLEKEPIPVIKRFSGGGTVIVDPGTLFITFIFQKEAHCFPPYPEPILKWSAELYKPLFEALPFQLRENDYVIGEKKCGGNAQYIQKNRWLHHTSFLWNFEVENMQYLLYPKKTPPYREGRSHENFLCKLSDYFPDKKGWIDSLKRELGKRFELQMVPWEDIQPIRSGPHRKTLSIS